MSTFDDRDLLRNVLLLDAATCAVTGAFMIAGAAFLSAVTRIPGTVLWVAGLSLLPVAAFITGVVARGSPPIGVWIVISGNAVWAIASLPLLPGLSAHAPRDRLYPAAGDRGGGPGGVRVYRLAQKRGAGLTGIRDAALRGGGGPVGDRTASGAQRRETSSPAACGRLKVQAKDQGEGKVRAGAS